jgi:hypothetical protein
MATAGRVLELRRKRWELAFDGLRAALAEVAGCAETAEGSDLGEVLIRIREVGIDPLEAIFAAGVRRFDRSGEYAACPRLKPHLPGASWATSTWQ